jgi:hypothetical protein
MSDFTIRFYRSQEWSDRFARAGYLKSAGMTTSHIHYTEKAATWLAAHINSMQPEQPCEVVRIG